MTDYQRDPDPTRCLPKLLMVYFSGAPATHALGPATTIEALRSNLAGIVDTELATLNFDSATGLKIFPGGPTVELRTENGLTYFLNPGRAAWAWLIARIQRRPDIVMIHCLYDARLAIPALIWCFIRKPALLLHMPHGIFMDVIQTKNKLRKKAWLRVLGSKFVSSRVIHVVSSNMEATDAANLLGPRTRTRVIPHFSVRPPDSTSLQLIPKVPNTLRMVLVGRVADQKNVTYAIARMAEASVACTLDVFGEIADPEYMKHCADLVKSTGLSDRVTFAGVVPQHELLQRLPSYDLLFLPTKGENFGQAIIEAMYVGLPVLLSELTPWSDVQQFGAGWALPLSGTANFVDAIQSAFRSGADDWAKARASAVAYAKKTNDPANAKELWTGLIREACPVRSRDDA